jgi:organic hydroperoxide reductase OsmC/OhrA
MATDRIHRYRARASWAGGTGVGYDHYDRGHAVTTSPSGPVMALSSDPAFGGDAGRTNPEQLLLAAAVSCQLLSFLAVAARARLDVVAYEDDAEAVMPESDPPVRITEIRLHPRITVRGPVTEDRIHTLCQVAHRECFIANSVTCRMVIDPTVVIVGPAG